MSIRIIELGRVGEETRGNMDPTSPDIELTPKMGRRNRFFFDLGV